MKSEYLLLARGKNLKKQTFRGYPVFFTRKLSGYGIDLITNENEFEWVYKDKASAVQKYDELKRNVKSGYYPSMKVALYEFDGENHKLLR